MKILKDEDEAKIKYDATITICSNGFVKLKEYEKTLSKLKDGYEPAKDLDTQKKGRQKARKDAEIDRWNLNRTRNTLIEYASENDRLWNSFITLTFKENIEDVTEANKKFHDWVRMISRKYPDHAYLAVPEFQKRGAVHYHLLDSLRCGYEIPARELRRTWNPTHKKWYDLTYYDIPYWQHGFSTAEDLSTFDDSFNCALYITKYLFKDVDNRLFGRNKILKSNNLKAPSKYYVNTETFKGALAYLIGKGYPVTAFHYVPVDQFGTPSTIWKVPRLEQEDCSTIEDIVYADTFNYVTGTQ